jgi:superfamily I DNA and RNA helicase
MQIPPGPQRIRGMAGSGKSILLCQKAARMHYKYPTKDIALVFFTRSLYGLIIDLVDQWVRHFSGGKCQFNPHISKLKVLHAWGGKNQAGLYSTLCRASGVKALSVNDFPQQSPNEGLGLACTHLLNMATIPQMFDAILIDEGQDLIVNEALKFEDKQPFYWMAYQALKPVDPDCPERRCLIWAYDELQSLNSLLVPTSRQVLGESLSQSIGGSSGGFYEGGIRKAYVIRRCYRSPNRIITAAHVLAMGLLRPKGMLTGLTNKNDWTRLGYEVEGNFKKNGSTITLRRPPENSPNPVQQQWDGELLEFNVFQSRQAELAHLVEKIKVNLTLEKLNPSQDILVITLGSMQLQNQTAKFLLDNGIDFYIPTAPDNNSFLNGMALFPNKFWNEGGVTVSRVHRAKGNEASIVYVVGIDSVARNESNIQLRNQLFVALTRARGWVSLSGTGYYPMYKEISQVIESKDTFTFTFQQPKHDIGESA